MRKATRVKEPPCALCGFDGRKWYFELKPLIKQLVARCFLSVFAGAAAELISKEYVDNVQYRTNLGGGDSGLFGYRWRQSGRLAPRSWLVDCSITRAAPLGKHRLGVNRIESVVGSTVVTVHIDRPLLVDQPINFRLTDLQ